MKIAMASDHAGFSLKEEIARVLKGQGHEIEDFGAYGEDAVDLSDHVYPAALAVGPRHHTCPAAATERSCPTQIIDVREGAP